MDVCCVFKTGLSVLIPGLKFLWRESEFIAQGYRAPKTLSALPRQQNSFKGKAGNEEALPCDLSFPFVCYHSANVRDTWRKPGHQNFVPKGPGRNTWHEHDLRHLLCRGSHQTPTGLGPLSLTVLLPSGKPRHPSFYEPVF